MILGIPKKTLIIVGALVAVMLMLSFRDGGGAGASGGGGCEFSVKADVLNVRQSPAINAPVVGKLTGQQQTQAKSTVRNGFREISPNRWVSAQFLEPNVGNSC